jgi:hypothetical protein
LTQAIGGVSRVVQTPKIGQGVTARPEQDFQPDENRQR